MNDERDAVRRWGAVVVAAAVIAFLPALWNGFVWDDRFQVAGNAIVQGKQAVWSAFANDFWALGGSGHERSNFYRPLITLSLWADARIGGGAAWWFHLTNVVAHAVASVGVMFVARRFGLATRAAGIAAVLFAVHPAHLESVAWVSGRTDAIAVAFLLWALVARGPASWGLGALALLSKEVAIVWPLLAAIRDRRWSWRERAPELAIVAAILVARRVVLGTTIGHGGHLDVLAAVLGPLHGLGLLVAPWLDAHMYLVPTEPRVLWPGAAIGGLVVAALAWRAWVNREAHWWCAAAVVALGPGAVGLALGQVYGARLGYLASAFVLMVVAEAVSRWRGGRVGALVVAASLAVVTAIGTRAWRDDLTFLEAVARRGPPEALINAAVLRHDAGALLDAWRTLDRVEALRASPESAYLRGLILAEVGCTVEAAKALTRAIELRPRYAEAWTNLASLLRSSGRPHGALELIAAARAQGIDSPAIARIAERAREAGEVVDRPLTSCSAPVETLLADPERLHVAALARGREGEPQQGLIVVAAALKIRPDWSEAYVTKAQLHYLAAQHAEAIEAAERALALDPTQTRAFKPLGLAARALGDVGRARDAIGRYLAAHPRAPDGAELRVLVGP